MALKNSWTTGETFTASDQNNVATEILGINASGVYASLPTVGHPGRTYLCTDNGNRYRDNGTTWDLVSVGGFGRGGVEPPSSGWTTTTLGSSTFAADKGGRLLTVPTAAGINCRVEYRTLSPTSNYTATVCLGYPNISVSSWESGIWLRNSSSGSLIQFGLSMVFGPSLTLQAFKYTNATTFSSGYGTAITSGFFLGPINWLRFRDDGTNRYLEYSYDGVGWITYFSVGRTDFITPDQIGWGLDNQGSGATQSLRLRSFSIA